MSKGQTERSWTSDDLTGLVILRAVAWTHVLVGGSIPWNDATQVSAHGVDGIVSDAILSSDQIVSITLKTLDQLSVTWLMCSLPRFELDLVTIGIKSSESSGTTSLGRWNEEVDETTA